MLLAAVVVMAAPAFAQNAFSDVPTDHWAYSAVEQLANVGLIEGYPDGTFKGKRTLTRYEYAVIIARLLPYLGDDSLSVNSFATKKDLDDYAKLSDIKGLDHSGCVTKHDLEIIGKLATEFKSELDALGVDVNALTADVNALKSRVSALEDEQARVKINGNLTVGGIYAFKKDTEAYDYDGYNFTEGNQGTEIVSDFQLDIKGRVNNNINAYMTLVAGDYINKRFNSTTDNRYWNNNTFDDMTIMPYYVYAAANFGKWGDFKTGRMPFQLNKYVYKKYDADSYFDICRMDNGDYQFDGIDYTVDFGDIDLRAWFGLPVSEQSDYYDPTLDDYYIYNFNNYIKTKAGAQLGANICGARVEALLDYNQMKKDGTQPENCSVYGATLAIPFGSFGIDGAWFQQKNKDYEYMGKDLDKDKANLFNVNGNFNWNGFLASAGYLEVEEGYTTPADYLSLPTGIHNLNNIKGFNGMLGYTNGNFDVYGNYKEYKEITDFISLFAEKDKIKYWNAGLGYNFGKFGKLAAKYEELDLFGQKIDYITVSWLKKLGNANFKLSYQNINEKDVDNGKANIIYGQAGYTF